MLKRRMQSVLRPQSFVAPRGMEPRIIEVLGLSGAGKSTFVSHIRRHRRNPSFWATRAEILGAPDRQLLRNSCADDLMFSLLQRRMAEIIGKGRDSPLRVRDSYTTFTRFFDRISLENAVLPCHVVEDEGFFFTFRHQIIEWAADDPDLLGSLAARHAFVVIRCDPLVAVENLRRREAAGGKVLVHHRGCSDADLLCMAERDALVVNRMVDLLRRAGVPMLEIEALSPPASNAARFEAAFG